MAHQGRRPPPPSHSTLAVAHLKAPRRCEPYSQPGEVKHSGGWGREREGGTKTKWCGARRPSPPLPLPHERYARKKGEPRTRTAGLPPLLPPFRGSEGPTARRQQGAAVVQGSAEKGGFGCSSEGAPGQGREKGEGGRGHT